MLEADLLTFAVVMEDCKWKALKFLGLFGDFPNSWLLVKLFPLPFSFNLKVLYFFQKLLKMFKCRGSSINPA